MQRFNETELRTSLYDLFPVLKSLTSKGRNFYKKLKTAQISAPIESNEFLRFIYENKDKDWLIKLGHIILASSVPPYYSDFKKYEVYRKKGNQEQNSRHNSFV